MTAVKKGETVYAVLNGRIQNLETVKEVHKGLAALSSGTTVVAKPDKFGELLQFTKQTIIRYYAETEELKLTWERQELIAYLSNVNFKEVPLVKMRRIAAVLKNQ
jgi:hypothetical protein